MSLIIGLVLLAALLLVAALKVLPEYEKGVILMLGRFQSVSGPGLILVVPGLQEMTRVDTRIRTIDIPEQDVITRDNITISVNAVLYYRVVQPKEAILSVEDFHVATEQLAQTTLRSVLGQCELDDILAKRDELSSSIQEILDTETDNWGIKVANVELKHVGLDETMLRAMARQAEAERSRRAKVIHAIGELEASKNLVEAAEAMDRNPSSMQLRYLQTLTEITKDGNNSTIVFPMPTDILRQLFQQIKGGEPALPPPAKSGGKKAQ